MKTKLKGCPDRIIHYPPADVLENVRRHPLGVGFHVVCLGWFPEARGSGIERPRGLNECIMIFCTKGKGWFETDGRRVVVGAGEVLIIPPNKAHAYHADDEDPWSIHWAHFSGTAAASYASLLPPHEHVMMLPAGDFKAIANMFRESYRLASTGFTERTLLLVSHILRHALGILFFQIGTSLSGSARAIAHDLTKSIEFMRANVACSLTLQELSRHAGLSPARFSSLFRDQTGSSPVEHYIRLRMQAACHYLDTTALSVKEVAAELGYDDPYYFSRIFQKTLGCSPLAYRRSVKG
ncbi:MAG: helix-turn-helix domain-containing protein [Verrucomicrobia bacterium]|nr:helix-turn-helix domain-containing protein [Verrucomicrobiota bacterium]